MKWRLGNGIDTSKIGPRIYLIYKKKTGQKICYFIKIQNIFKLIIEFYFLKKITNRTNLKKKQIYYTFRHE